MFRSISLIERVFLWIDNEFLKGRPTSPKKQATYQRATHCYIAVYKTVALVDLTLSVFESGPIQPNWN